MKYIYIMFFLTMNNTDELKIFWQVEFLNNKKFSWVRIFSYLIKGERINFMFWWRLANAMYTSGNRTYKRAAKKLQNKLIAKYNTEIELGAKIGVGLKIHHFSSVIISKFAIIGNNFTCYQNITIGARKAPYSLLIGNNVTMGCGSTVLGGEIVVGDNVKIGAMSLVISSIPSNCTYISEKTNKIILIDKSV